MQKPTATEIKIDDYNQYLRVLGDLSEPSLLNFKDGYLRGWFNEAAPEPKPTLPEIVFDNDGWSQELRASDGQKEYFHIYRLPGSGSRYVLKDKSGKTFSVVLPFAGILALASSRIRGGFFSGNIPPLSPETVTDYDRRTNFGAY